MFLAQAATEALEGQPMWAQIVYMAVTGLVALFLLPYLKRLAEKARADAEASNQSAKETLLNRLKALALDEAGIIAEQRFPVIAASVLQKKMTKEQIKTELKTWGEGLKKKLIEYFNREGIDLVAVVGDAMLDDVVRWAADKTGPFAGKETAVALLQDEWTNKLVKYGVEWVRQHWLAQPGN